MASHGEEKDLKEFDAFGQSTNNALNDEPVAENPESASPDDFEKARLEEKYPGSAAQEKKPDYGRTSTALSDSTELSEITKEKSKVEEPKRSLWDKLNPLKIKPPPVPEEREECREYKAGWFSLLTWNWVTPLMTVSCFLSGYS